MQRKWTLRLKNSSQFLIHLILHLPKCMGFQYLNLPQRVVLEKYLKGLSNLMHNMQDSNKYCECTCQSFTFPFINNRFLTFLTWSQIAIPHFDPLLIPKVTKDTLDTFDLLHFQMWTRINLWLLPESRHPQQTLLFSFTLMFLLLIL